MKLLVIEMDTFLGLFELYWFLDFLCLCWHFSRSFYGMVKLESYF